MNSRILFDQMLGRATRLCPEIGKESFRVFDAVRIYEALQSMTAMQPVVVNPSISFAQLGRELATVATDAQRELVREQFVAKLQRKKQHLTDAQSQDFEARAGMTPDAFIRELRTKPLADIAAWFTQNPDLGEILDRPSSARRAPTLLSTHDDSLIGIGRGYGSAEKPEDFLREFSAFIKSRGNRDSGAGRGADSTA